MGNTELYSLLTSLLTKNTPWPQRIELCLHYDTLPFPPSRASQPSLPVLAEDSLFFTAYPRPAARLHLSLWAEMKASGSGAYIWLRGRPLRAGRDKTTLPSSLLFFLQPSIPPFIFYSFHQILPSSLLSSLKVSSVHWTWFMDVAIILEQGFSTSPTSDW